MIAKDQSIQALVLKMHKGSKKAEESLYIQLRDYAFAIARNMIRAANLVNFEPEDCEAIIFSCFEYFKKSYSVNRGPALHYFRYILSRKLYGYICAEAYVQAYCSMSLDDTILDDGDPLYETISVDDGHEPRSSLNVSYVLEEIFKRNRKFKLGTRNRKLRDYYLLKYAGYDREEIAEIMDVSYRTLQRYDKELKDSENYVNEKISKHLK